MPKLKPKICLALNCDNELDGNKSMYCDNKCKQSVKNAVNSGRQCNACHKVIKVPIPVMGGMKRTCNRVRCRKARGDS